MRIWIKFCGTTCIEDALASIEAGADALGFVFAPSKRRVSAEQAREMAKRLPQEMERIGVFRDESVEGVAEVAKRVGLSGVQLHGEETPAFIKALRTKLSAECSISIIKTIVFNDQFETHFAHVCQDYDYVDSILLDSGGGSGRTFDWEKAQPFLGPNRKRLIVAGGLNPDNVDKAIRKFLPWGVDVVSGVEREPGRKDPERLKAFVAAVRKAEQL